MNKQAESSDQAFMRKLAEQMLEPRQYKTSYIAVNSSAEQPPSLARIMDIEESDLSPVSQNALAAIEELAGEEDIVSRPLGSWQSFKWKLLAFQYIQDILDAPLFAADDTRRLFHLVYFYFESRQLLTESILCGLNGFSRASRGLLRPFLEFSLLQNYYFARVKADRSYMPLSNYIERGRHPSWNAIMRTAIPDDSFCRPIRFRIQSHLSALSESSSHPYHPDISPTHYEGSAIKLSFEKIYFWYETQCILDAALWIYYANFPMLFSPVEILRKYGFNPPLGLFIDQSCGHVVQRSLTTADYSAFCDYASKQDTVKRLLEWYHSFGDLTEAEIISTWDTKEDGPFPGISEGLSKMFAKLRVLKLAMALPPDSREEINASEALFKELHTREGWMRLGRNRKQKNEKN